MLGLWTWRSPVEMMLGTGALSGRPAGRSLAMSTISSSFETDLVPGELPLPAAARPGRLFASPARVPSPRFLLPRARLGVRGVGAGAAASAAAAAAAAAAANVRRGNVRLR